MLNFMSMNKDFKMTATTLFGLEGVLADELKKLKWEHVAAKLVTVYDKILAQRA